MTPSSPDPADELAAKIRAAMEAAGIDPDTCYVTDMTTLYSVDPSVLVQEQIPLRAGDEIPLSRDLGKVVREVKELAEALNLSLEDAAKKRASTEWAELGGDLEGRWDGGRYVLIRAKGYEAHHLFLSRTGLERALALLPPKLPLHPRQDRIDAGKCMAGMDGECFWLGCPQENPATRLPHCPRDQGEEDE